MRLTHSVRILLCGLLAGCAADPSTLPDWRLAGTWRNAEGVSISFEDTGVMVVERPGPRMKPILGDWSMIGGVASLRYRPEARLCVDDVGTYRIDLSGDRFMATVVNETCDARRKSFEGEWKRTAAGRVTNDR
jgi:hypothetical protein